MTRRNPWKVVSPTGAIWWFHGETAQSDARAKLAQLADSGLHGRLFELTPVGWVER